MARSSRSNRQILGTGEDGVQLRGHRRGGGPVPRPRPPPPQHDAHRSGGVAQDDASELVVRPQPRPRRRAQVRLRACHARRLLQVPPPPRQLPRPRPPAVASLRGRLRRAAAGRGPAVLPHRRGAVTATKERRPAQPSSG
ncbi:hypothetical protein BS78_06G080900 [Paspalum vaginatum]|nr:hypothetical protein BS78_06G080900 [Paspalum vaginatum]